MKSPDVDNMPVAVFVRCLGCGLHSEDSGGEILFDRASLEISKGAIFPPKLCICRKSAIPKHATSLDALQYPGVPECEGL